MNDDEPETQSDLGAFGGENGELATSSPEEAADTASSSPKDGTGLSTALYENPSAAIPTDDERVDDHDELSAVFIDYIETLDPQLIKAGWLFASNKSVEYGKIDQSMLNHTRNLVFFLHRLATQAETSELQSISADELRDLIALAVAHDFHKLRPEDDDRGERFNITTHELESFVSEVGVLEFAPALSLEDLRSCAVDHHENARSAEVTLTWEDYRPLIRLADGMASCPTPQKATAARMQDLFRDAFPGASVNLANHHLDHVSGIFTNLLNGAVSDYLAEQHDYTVLTIYQDGCVYLAPTEEKAPANTEEVVDTLAQRVSDNISESHPAYQNLDQLQSNFSIVGAQGLYSLNDPDFFYAGADQMLRATVRKGVTDGEMESEPSDSARESMEMLADALGTSFSMTEQQYGVARFVNTIKGTFVKPLLDDPTSADLIRATVAVFDLSESLAESLVDLPEDVVSSLTNGGKWEYSYAIAQEILNRHGEGAALRNAENDIINTLQAEIGTLAGDEQEWVDTIQTKYAGRLASEVSAFIGENLRVGAGGVTDTEQTTDTFDEYTKKSRGKTCTLCSRGVQVGGNLGPMKSKKSLSTLQGGFSNRELVGGTKRDKLLLCAACRIEFSLRETAAQRRDDGRLFFHLVPDYFYTPFSWRLHDRLINRFTGDNRVRMGRLAEAVFDMETPEGFGSIMNELTQPEGNGRTMFESLSRDFDQNLQFGSQTVGYFKSPDNETEFQFFGAFLALTVSAYTGMRVYMSESPIPEMRARDFPEFAKLGGGFTQVTEFYGESVPLSQLQPTLRRAAALIQLGHALQGSSRNDSLFAKYLRVARNELLPGAHLLKRAAQSSDEGSYVPALMRYAVALDEHNGIAPLNSTMDDTPHNRITRLAELAFDAIRPASHRNKPHRVERVFRESVKAVTKTGEQLGREDYQMLVAGRLQKMLDRQAGNGIYPVSQEKSDAGTPLQERIEDYAVFFVDEILFGIANGRPSQLKRLENNLADGFFGATLRAERRFYDERNANESETELTADADSNAGN